MTYPDVIWLERRNIFGHTDFSIHDSSEAGREKYIRIPYSENTNLPIDLETAIRTLEQAQKNVNDVIHYLELVDD